jgi:hypothetical protein
MKKSTFPISVALLFCLAFASRIQAENIRGAYPKSISNSSITRTDDLISGRYSFWAATGERVVKNFLKYYPGATKVQWAALQDNSSECHFFLNGMQNRALFAKNGSWIFTITTYGESNLDAEVRRIVRSEYYDYSITCVNEISTPENPKVYLISVQDARTIKMLRVQDGEMELLQKFEKSDDKNK